jgi:hypothetical protein
MSGQAAIHCPQSSGFFLTFFPYIQVNFCNSNLFFFFFLNHTFNFKMYIIQNIYAAVSLVPVSDTQGFHYTKYRQNVMLQSIGLHANVLLIW